jgi:hypothetical protein
MRTEQRQKQVQEVLHLQRTEKVKNSHSDELKRNNNNIIIINKTTTTKPTVKKRDKTKTRPEEKQREMR